MVGSFTKALGVLVVPQKIEVRGGPKAEGFLGLRPKGF